MAQEQEPPGGASKEHGLSLLLMALSRVEHRLSAVEAKLERRPLTIEQIVKLIIGFGLPLLVLLLTGSAETARRFIGVF